MLIFIFVNLFIPLEVRNIFFKDQMGRNVSIPFPPGRIISTVPSQTELLFELGLDAAIVGVTKFCVHPAGKVFTKTKIGGTKTLNLKKIRDLQPDLILANKEENDQAQIEELMKEFPVWISDIYTLNDAEEMIRLVGCVVDRRVQAEKLVEAIDWSFNALRADLVKKRAGYFIWKNPYMIAGHETFINSLLARAGFQNAFNYTRYQEVTAADIIGTCPDVIFLSSEPYPFKEKHLEEFYVLCPAARVVLVDGELFSWYGSRLKYTAAYLQEIQVRVNQ